MTLPGARIVIRHHNGTPPYEQLRNEIIARIQSGQLVAGTKIPTVRGLAEDLGLAPNTVARTYRRLEELGVLETRGRSGTFVAASGDPTRDEAARAATAYVAAVRELGIGDKVAIDLVKAALR